MNEIELSERILIAQFLHGEDCMTVANGVHAISVPVSKTCSVVNPLPFYQKNWNDLYPVIEKIAALGFAFKTSVQNDGGVFTIHEGRNMNGYLGTPFIRVESNKQNRFSFIKATYVAIVEFIRWYIEEQRQLIERSENVVLSDDQVIMRFMGDGFIDRKSWDTIMEIWAKLKKDGELLFDWNVRNANLMTVMGGGDLEKMYSLIVTTIDWYDSLIGKGRIEKKNKEYGQKS